MLKPRNKILSVFLALAMVIALFAPLGGTALAAQGDYVGLADFSTIGSFRPNTYDADINDVGEYYQLKIVPIIDNGQGGTYSGWFASAAEADPSNFVWTQNTPLMYNGYIDESTAVAVQDPTTNGWYYSVDAYNVIGTLGPDSWRLTYTPPAPDIYGDFSFVATAYIAQDSGTVDDISIEFYDYQSASPFATGYLGTVNGSDNSAPTGAHGRSYSTALDAVGHAMYPSNIISDYDTYYQTQMLDSVTDLSNTPHYGDGISNGWMYGVYYHSSGTTWNLDPYSEYIGPDDYLLQDGALVIWKIGNLADYDSDFPAQITRP